MCGGYPYYFEYRGDLGFGYNRGPGGRIAFKDCLLYKATFIAGIHYFEGTFDGNIVDDLLPTGKYPGPYGDELTMGPNCIEWLPKLSHFFMIFNVGGAWKTFLFDPVLKNMTYVS